LTFSPQASGLSQLLRGPAPVSFQPIRSALIYCEGQFNHLDGKTAHGLVRHCEAYRIAAVIDSHCAGLDAGLVLDGVTNGIPIVRDLEAGLALEGERPRLLIYGMAPATGLMNAPERQVLLQAMAAGLDLVQGLREFLNDDPQFAAAAAHYQVTIRDVRRVPALKDLRLFSGAIATVDCPRIAVLGTDGAIGKRTTATRLVQALNQAGLRAALVNTGQTGLMQGGRHGIALDAIPSQFCSGEVEAAVVQAWEQEHPQVIVIEGQGALSHPAYLSSAFILRGCQPQAVILQHAPRRQWLSDFSHVAMPSAASEIRLIEAFAATRVIGLTINHEEMDDAAITTAIALYEAELAIPVTDALSRPPERLVQMVLRAFPALAPALAAPG
jgi:uncharacterized NAD-dependent epimerase/dehydratase family protein